MATEDELRGENAQLRRELAMARRGQEHAAHPGIIQGETQAAGQWNALDQEIKRLQAQHADVLAEGKFTDASELQRQIGVLAGRQEQARAQWQQWNGLRQANPVEQFIAANRHLYSEADMAWIRAHPDYATDPVFRQRIIEADQEAQRDSKRVGTAEYYARLDRRAAEHSVDAGGAARGEPVMLTDDKLEVARGIWQSMHPYDPPPDVKTLSRAWHEWNHSPQAHRQREQSAERQAFQGAASSLRPRW